MEEERILLEKLVSEKLIETRMELRKMKRKYNLIKAVYISSIIFTASSSLVIAVTASIFNPIISVSFVVPAINTVTTLMSKVSNSKLKIKVKNKIEKIKEYMSDLELLKIVPTLEQYSHLREKYDFSVL